MTSESGNYQRLWALFWHRKFVFIFLLSLSLLLLFTWQILWATNCSAKSIDSLNRFTCHIPWIPLVNVFHFESWDELRHGCACIRILNPKSKHFHNRFSTWKCFINSFVVFVYPFHFWLCLDLSSHFSNEWN